MSDELLVACAVCSVPFEPGPDSFMEFGYAAFASDEAAPSQDAVTDIDLETADAETLLVLGIDEDARKAMMAAKPGDHIETGAIAVCEKCQKAMLDAAEHPQG